ncbi:mitochondrial potassium channel-like [Oppia nitens]|uniref:mitochondrial potassium channel-like n=1 Tax=Oppia nitens TaxID=1686743 RepID=UPI0023DC0039|nr:mitochondrial potassium channel-like [Oppia nitens]XP_054159548.1 mitochondrial potassium channel-like [Oppia nitens]
MQKLGINSSNIQSLGRHLKPNFSFSLNQKFKKWFDIYEDFIGVKEVRKTQEAVLKSESEFVGSTKARRDVQNQMIGLQEQLKQIRQKLDSTHRSDESYLTLITREHQFIKEEIQLLETLRRLEETERQLFSQFSNKLREAHEVERVRQEKTKYLSMLGTIIGACLGIIATSVNHAFKRRDFKELAKMIETSNASKVALNSSSSSVATTTSEPLAHENNSMASNATIAKSTVITMTTTNETQTDPQSTTRDDDNKIVECIANTESNLEYKMKVNSLTTVVVTYALIAITLPIIIRVFSD